MIISHSRKFVFIHIYKTAGTSVTDALAPHARLRERVQALRGPAIALHLFNRAAGLSDDGNRWLNGVHKHAHATDLRDYLGADRFRDYFVFSFVRNPFDWQVSLYEYIRQAADHREHAVANRQAFKTFCLERITRGANTQSAFLTGDAGLLCDFVGKVENIEADFSHICERIGIAPPPLRTLNRSKNRAAISAYYDDELAERVRTHYAEDFRNFGYLDTP